MYTCTQVDMYASWQHVYLFTCLPVYLSTHLFRERNHENTHYWR